MTLKQPIHQTEEEREKVNVVLTGVWSVHARGDSYTVSARLFLNSTRQAFRARLSARQRVDHEDVAHLDYVRLLSKAVAAKEALFPGVVKSNSGPWCSGNS
jgi:hypothetical protein